MKKKAYVSTEQYWPKQKGSKADDRGTKPKLDLFTMIKTEYGM